MIKRGEPKVCPICGGALKLYDRVSRTVRSGYGVIDHIKIYRYKCKKCAKVHRELPGNLMPYKQFKAEIIIGVCDGTITTDNLEFEDYPCEMTMKRWADEYKKTQ